MTVSSIVPVNNYTGNSSVKKFDFDFLIEDENELVVQYTNKMEETKILTLGVDYSINEIGNPNGSYITFPLESSTYNVLTNNEKISLMLSLDIKQESEFKNSSYFNLNILEWTFDYIIRILQILNRKIERSVKISEGASYTPNELINEIKTSEINAIQAANVASNAKTFIEQNEALACVAEDIQGPNNIAQVLANKVNIDKVANSISNVNAVGNGINNINSVAENQSNINIVSTNQNNINTCANNINDIKNAYNSSKDCAKLAKSWAVSDVAVENGLYSAKYYAQHVQGLSDVTYNDLRASSALVNEGYLLTNDEAFSDIQEYAHSTFNSSNYEVTGNLEITQDGIASGFSTNNYIKIPALESVPEELEISCKFKGSSLSTAPQNSIFGWYNSETSLFRVFLYLKNTIRCDFIPSNTSTFTSLTYNGNIDEEYTVRLVYKDKVLKFYVNDELAGKYEREVNLTCLTGTSGRIGTQLTGGWYLGNGLIDLKYFNIKVNGKLVYSGNKTGLDVIKPNDYTVVGNPTITDDGIASDFSTNNNINTIKLSDIVNNTFEICCDFKLKQTGQSCIFSSMFGGNTKYGIALIENGGSILFYASSNGTSWDIAQPSIVVSAPSVVAANVNYRVKLKFDGLKYTITLINLDTNESNEIISLNSSEKINSNVNFINIGGKGYWTACNGSIDLNAFKIYVDGNLVYQPCLKIPYTESKTGSKIVDVAYRDRVQDVYEQSGTAMYYTIDEENKNFTLPMGEIYGMIEQKTDKSTLDWHINQIRNSLSFKLNKDGSNSEFPYIKETYSNDGLWYRVWSDGWCEQGGTINSLGTTSWVEISLLKQMNGSNYTILATNKGSSNDIFKVKAGDSSKNTSSSFFLKCENANTGVNFEIKGYCLLT